jgi:hypothetical protein
MPTAQAGQAPTQLLCVFWCGEERSWERDPIHKYHCGNGPCRLTNRGDLRGADFDGVAPLEAPKREKAHIAGRWDSFEHFQVSENTLEGQEGVDRALSGYHSFESIPISKHGRDRRSNSGLERKKAK